MPRYVIERTMPGAGDLDAATICATINRSAALARERGGLVQWERSYVTGGKVFCVCTAPSEQHVIDHERAAGMPVDAVLAITQEFDPATSGA
jgi:hypothetical protein